MDVGIGIGQDKNPFKAGKEMAEEGVKELGHSSPRFALLYATQYIRECGGYKEMLDGVFSVLPKETPLIGGTVVGFMTNKITATRGAVLFLVYDEGIEVAASCAHNTKRWPKMAGKRCARKLKKMQTSHKDDMVFTVISGTKVPQFPIMRVDFIRNRFLGALTRKGFTLMEKMFQMGFGNEEKVLKGFSSTYPECNLIHNSSTEHKLEKNYQFFYNKVYTDCIVAMRISHSKDFYSDFSAGIDFLSEKLNFDKVSRNKKFIHWINNKPALQEILRIMRWKEEKIPSLLDTDKYTFYPFVYFDYENKPIISVWPMVYGNSLGLTNEFNSSEGYLAFCSGNSLISAMDNILPENFRPEVGFFSSCAIRLFGLGRELKEVKKKTDNYFGQVPYLVVYGAGEAQSLKNKKKVKYLNNTIVSGLLGRR